MSEVETEGKGIYLLIFIIIFFAIIVILITGFNPLTCLGFTEANTNSTLMLDRCFIN